MQKEKKAKITNFLLNIVIITMEQYLKELFIAIHIVLTKIPSEIFAFGMVVIVAIIISLLKTKEEK